MVSMSSKDLKESPLGLREKHLDTPRPEPIQSAVITKFQSLFATTPRLFRAPGRVNLIGEHTDYNQGFVLPMAIGFYTWAAASPRGDRKIVVHSQDFNEQREITLGQWEASSQKHWSNYVFGVAQALEERAGKLSGANIFIHGNVPIGAGLSSSAALEVATGLALLSLSGRTLDRTELALACQYAENQFVGTQCGIMDQFVSAHGREGAAVLLDCRSLEHRLFSIPDEAAIVICNTMIEHEHSTGEYNVRRAECEQGVRILQKSMPHIQALRDVTPEELERHKSDLPEIVYRRCRHVVTEDARTLAATDALQSHDLREFGVLMQESHRSLKDDYEVSCPELDLMAELANRTTGCLGGRMTGGGFGGCTVNLVETGAVPEFIRQVSAAYKAETGIAPETYTSLPSSGATEII